MGVGGDAGGWGIVVGDGGGWGIVVGVEVVGVVVVVVGGGKGRSCGESAWYAAASVYIWPGKVEPPPSLSCLTVGPASSGALIDGGRG